MSETMQRIVLAARPVGAPKDSDFRLEEAPMPTPGDGEILCRTIFMSLDPYMRGRMDDRKSYATPVPLGGVMEGGTVSEVIASHNANFAVGDIVEGRTGWLSHAVSNGAGLRKVNADIAPISTALGVLGMPGMTAYAGMRNIGQPKAGETVVVAAASGAVGAVVGQIAQIHGCRAVGVAGSDEKCAYVTDTLGFDACLNHNDPELPRLLKDACPDGIDVYFENVAGKVLEAVIPRLNPFSRVPVCGLIAQYNATGLGEGQNMLPALMRQTLTNRVLWRGFIVSDFWDQFADFEIVMSDWIGSGKVKYKEDRVSGLENAPKAFQGLLRGENFGKLVVQVGDDPTA
jgi:NADPH-dependent curcumin reductase CurA